MVKFIELTDFEDQPLMVNVSNIIWICPNTTEDGTIIYVMTSGENGYPVCICVKENYTQVTKLIRE